MDPRVRARRIEVARSHGRRRFRRLAVLLALSFLVLLAVALTRSPLLDVDTVRVEGVARTDPDLVRGAAGIETKQPMTSVDLGAAEDRVEALPWVADAKVERQWPATVSVSVTERVPVAVAGDGPGAVLVDRDGRILGAATSSDQVLPVAGPDPVEGPGALVPENQRRLVATLAALPDDMRDQVVRGTVDGSGLGMELRDGIEVHLGDRTRLSAKIDALTVVLDQADRGSIATVDVAVPAAAAVTRRVPSQTLAADVGEQTLTADDPGGA